MRTATSDEMVHVSVLMGDIRIVENMIGREEQFWGDKEAGADRGDLGLIAVSSKPNTHYGKNGESDIAHYFFEETFVGWQTSCWRLVSSGHGSENLQ